MTVAAPPLLLRNATLFDGTGTQPRAGVDLLLRDGRVATIGAGLEATGGATVLDLGGRFVMPGIVDSHVHLTLSALPNDAPEMPTRPVATLAWDAARNARATLEAGITAVRDLGGGHEISIHLRDAVAAGTMPGPRIRAAGRAVCMTGGHGWWVGREADGPDDVRKAVREQLRAGADCIKLIASGGVMTPRVDPRSAQLTEEEMRAAVEEAHKAFVRVGAHAQATAGILNAVRAGVDSVEHGVYITDEVVAEMRERGTYLVATLVAPAMIARHGIAGGVPPYMVEKGERVLDDHQASFRRAYRAGVKIAMGTDAGTPFNRHGANAEEIALMVETGMEPLDALVAATRTSAELLNILDEQGTLEPGKAADLLVLAGDPQERIRLLTEPGGILAVMQGGGWVRSALPA